MVLVLSPLPAALTVLPVLLSEVWAWHSVKTQVPTCSQAQQPFLRPDGHPCSRCSALPATKAGPVFTSPDPEAMSQCLKSRQSSYIFSHTFHPFSVIQAAGELVSPLIAKGTNISGQGRPRQIHKVGETYLSCSLLFPYSFSLS